MQLRRAELQPGGQFRGWGLQDVEFCAWQIIEL